MRKKVLVICTLLVGSILLSACGKVVTNQHIEVYTVETTEETDDLRFKKTGYKKVNAITTFEESKNDMNIELKLLEDFYDLDGAYVRTEVSHSKLDESYVTKAKEEDERKIQLNEPSTILIPDDHNEHFQFDNMTKDEKEKVKEHVESFMEQL